MSDVYLHIGLHKTATTTLQQQFFPMCTDLDYLVGASVDQFTQHVISTDPIYYDAQHGRSLLEPLFHENRPALISRESFSGSLYAGVGSPNLDHRSPILHNLKSALPEAKVIVVLRKQDDLARSVYREYLKMGGSVPIRDFFGFNDVMRPIFPLDRFRYSAYVDELHAIFPSGVLVLVFEEFLATQSAYLQRLCTFLGIGLPRVKLQLSNSTSLGPVGLEVARLVGRLFRNQLNPAGLIPRIPVYRSGKSRKTSPIVVLHDRWPVKGKTTGRSEFQRVGDRVLNKVEEDNRLIDKKYDLGLSQYGYF